MERAVRNGGCGIGGSDGRTGEIDGMGWVGTGVRRGEERDGSSEKTKKREIGRGEKGRAGRGRGEGETARDTEADTDRELRLLLGNAGRSGESRKRGDSGVSLDAARITGNAHKNSANGRPESDGLDPSFFFFFFFSSCIFCSLVTGSG